MKIENLDQAEKLLQKFVPNVAKLTGDNLSLDRISKLMELADNPQDKLKIIHVAGTSGKTSTCYYIQSILQQSGKKTAMTVSPHINSITERLQINGNVISNEKFCGYLGEFLDYIQNSPLELSYFEVLIGLAFWVSDREDVDYLVLETGMGGTYDSSNIADRDDKVCVITDIGFDHMHILGDTLEQIAQQKAGIIYRSNVVFAYKQTDEVNNVLRRVSAKNNAALNLLHQREIERNSSLDLGNCVQYQRRNWLLAEQVCKYIAGRDGFQLSYPNTSESIVPGRMEYVHVEGVDILMDGAHNQQKMHTFVSSYTAKYENTKACILIAMKEGKEYKDVIDELKTIADKIIITQFKTSQDLPTVSENPLILRDYAEKIGIESEVVDSLADAVRRLIDCSNDHKIVTGSFYLISQVKKYLAE